MGMVLTEGEISTFQECVRRDLLTYVSYPSFKGATRCFAYPQFLVEDETLTLLEDSAFPDNGCLPMVTSRTTPPRAAWYVWQRCCYEGERRASWP